MSCGLGFRVWGLGSGVHLLQGGGDAESHAAEMHRCLAIPRTAIHASPNFTAPTANCLSLPKEKKKSNFAPIPRRECGERACE